MNILETIQIQGETLFSDSEKEVINYILTMPDALSQLTINQLAKNTYTSNATILRAIKKLGYSGYREFKLAFLLELETNKNNKKDINFTIPFTHFQNTNEIIEQIYSLHQECITIVRHSLDAKTLENIAELLITKRRIFIYAVGDSRIRAQSFINKLIKLDIYPILATKNHEEIFITQNIKKDDCALFITYSNQNELFTEAMKTLTKQNTDVILLSANYQAAQKIHCKEKVIFPDYEKDGKIATYYSQIAFDYILNTIHALIYQKLTH